jgi:hypothetical protein
MAIEKNNFNSMVITPTNTQVGVFLGWSLNSTNHDMIMSWLFQTDRGFVWIHRSHHFWDQKNTATHPSSPWAMELEPWWEYHWPSEALKRRNRQVDAHDLVNPMFHRGYNYSWLVVSNIWMIFHFIYGILPPIDFHIFQDGEIAPPSR